MIVSGRQWSSVAVCGRQWSSAVRPDLVQEVVGALGGAVVSTICQELAFDYPGMMHGAPDLLLLDGVRGSATFVEVKGPGDKLSEKQQCWIDCLLASGATVEICHVQSET